MGDLTQGESAAGLNLQSRQLPPKGSRKPPGNPGTPETPKTLHSIAGPKVENHHEDFRWLQEQAEQKLSMCDGRQGKMFTGECGMQPNSGEGTGLLVQC